MTHRPSIGVFCKWIAVRCRASAMAFGAAAWLAAPWVIAQPTNGARAGIERTASGRPKLDGIWQAFVTANWDIRPHAAAAGPVAALGASGAAPPGLGIVEGGEIPYLEWAKAQQAENYADRLARDPEVKCFMPGVPRATYMPQPFQIFQTDALVMLTYQYANAVRTVHLSDPGPAPTSFWMGWSVGHWEGDTLVVEVTKQKPDTWLDRAGNFHSASLRVVERYTPIDRDHLQYEATLEDAEVFSRPWKISFPLYRRIEADAQLLEFKCVPFAEEVMYGHLRKRSEIRKPQSESPR
jgi:hypothetical protein